MMKWTKKKENWALFSIGLAFPIMLGMILLDIIPEIQELTRSLENYKKIITILGFTGLGLLLLKGLDLFVPHHHHDHHDHEKNKIEHNEHLFHIGLITSISLIIHNMMEGISIYTTSLRDIKTGIWMALAVSLHNIPLGIEIAVGLESSNTKKKIKYLTITMLTLSSFLGAFCLFLLNNAINETILSAFLCITLGMLIYITLFELLREIWMNRTKRAIYWGLGIGIMINILMVIL